MALKHKKIIIEVENSEVKKPNYWVFKIGYNYYKRMQPVPYKNSGVGIHEINIIKNYLKKI